MFGGTYCTYIGRYFSFFTCKTRQSTETKVFRITWSIPFSSSRNSVSRLLCSMHHYGSCRRLCTRLPGAEYTRESRLHGGKYTGDSNNVDARQCSFLAVNLVIFSVDFLRVRSKLSHLQKQVCAHIVSAIAKEASLLRKLAGVSLSLAVYLNRMEHNTVPNQHIYVVFRQKSSLSLINE
jgi:hypothetical protein